eukprot:sb/3464512/
MTSDTHSYQTKQAFSSIVTIYFTSNCLKQILVLAKTSTLDFISQSVVDVVMATVQTSDPWKLHLLLHKVGQSGKLLVNVLDKVLISLDRSQVPEHYVVLTHRVHSWEKFFNFYLYIRVSTAGNSKPLNTEIYLTLLGAMFRGLSEDNKPPETLNPFDKITEFINWFDSSQLNRASSIILRILQKVASLCEDEGASDPNKKQKPLIEKLFYSWNRIKNVLRQFMRHYVTVMTSDTHSYQTKQAFSSIVTIYFTSNCLKQILVLAKTSTLDFISQSVVDVVMATVQTSDPWKLHLLLHKVGQSGKLLVNVLDKVLISLDRSQVPEHYVVLTHRVHSWEKFFNFYLYIRVSTAGNSKPLNTEIYLTLLGAMFRGLSEDNKPPETLNPFDKITEFINWFDSSQLNRASSIILRILQKVACQTKYWPDPILGAHENCGQRIGLTNSPGRSEPNQCMYHRVTCL